MALRRIEDPDRHLKLIAQIERVTDAGELGDILGTAARVAAENAPRGSALDTPQNVLIACAMTLAAPEDPKL